MRRLGEPEVDSWWLVSAAPPDYKLPPFLHFPWELRAVSGMWNDGVFPSLSSTSNTSFAGNSEFRIRNSNTFAELERQYGVDIFSTPQEDSDCFQLGSFPTPLSPATGLSATPLNSTPGDGDVLTATAATNLRPSTMTLIQPNSVVGCNKRMASSDSISKRTTSRQASKRLKTPEKLHQPPCNESASTHPQPMKAPARRSQKLGDKITALQQLVSPFGKTDTASVLHEATICIKFLHEQIQVLTAPYFRVESSPHLPGHGGVETSLLSRGLCLAPTSSTIVSLINQPESTSHSPERTTTATSSCFY